MVDEFVTDNLNVIFQHKSVHAIYLLKHYDD